MIGRFLPRPRLCSGGIGPYRLRGMWGGFKGWNGYRWSPNPPQITETVKHSERKITSVCRENVGSLLVMLRSVGLPSLAA